MVRALPTPLLVHVLFLYFLLHLGVLQLALAFIGEFFFILALTLRILVGTVFRLARLVIEFGTGIAAQLGAPHHRQRGSPTSSHQ